MKKEASEPRSYNVKTTDGSELRRNRVQLKPLEKTATQDNSNKESPSTHRNLSKASAYPQLSSPELPLATCQSSVPANLFVTTRMDRVLKKPSRLDL